MDSLFEKFEKGLCSDNNEDLLLPITVQDLQATLFPPSAAGAISRNTVSLSGNFSRLGSGSFLSTFLLKTNQLLIADERSGSTVRVKEPRELFASLNREQACPAQQIARWPAECQVLEERVEHIPFTPSGPEQFYVPHGSEAQPKALGEEYGSVVYQYHPISAINYFNRSCTGGNRFLHSPIQDIEADDLRFESRFESGNLAKVIKLTATFYELYLRSDMYTNKHMQWFYFRIGNVRRHLQYRFSIVNLSKGESLYNSGMKPLMYSIRDAKLHNIGWRRCGDNISYFCNENGNSDDDQPSTYTLTFTLEFPHDRDLVYLAHSYPYTYTDLQEYLFALINHPVKSTYSSLRLLCRTLAGNNVYYVTVTSQPNSEEEAKKKRAIVLTARVHPGESPSSWMMKGFMDFITSDTSPARELRDKFIFKLVPMLNPDGVIVGNSRCSLTGRDLNRQYRTVIRETYPSIWHTKLMVRRLIEECGVAMYCDFHSHSRQNNVFIYGCENRRSYDRYLQEQVFPLMLHKNAADKFSFENCKFRVTRAKEGTGRVVMWMMGIANSYTLEASFSGSDLGPRNDTHFSAYDYEQMGRSFCQTLVDFYDDAPDKERLRSKILKRLLKEGSTADEPQNIDLSDYSSDEGDSSSSDEGGNYNTSLIAPPPSPYLQKNVKKKQPLPIKPSVTKSPNVQRKLLPMYRTTLGLSLAESDFSDTDTEQYISSPRRSREKNRKAVRRKNPKKLTKITQHREHSDTELQIKKHSRLNVMELLPAEKLRSQSWNRYVGFPLPRTTTADNRVARTTTRQLAEVQAKLLTLRQRIWTGIDDNEPLSYGYSTFTANIIQQPPIVKEQGKGSKGSKKKNRNSDPDKSDKKGKKKCKKQKENIKAIKDNKEKDDVKQLHPKKKTGIKRQNTIDWTLYGDNPPPSRQIIKSKSFQENINEAKSSRNKEKCLVKSESCSEVEERRQKKTKKKKKRKTAWERRVKSVTSLNVFMKKS